MKKLLLLLSLSPLKEKPFHIKLDGTVGSIRLRKPGIFTRIINGFQSIVTLMLAPIQ